MIMQHTLQMRQEMQHPYARRLKAPRSGPAHAPPGPVTTSDTKALRGDRWRILLLLQAHPDGLSPAQTRQRLGIDKDLGDIMKAMARDGLLRPVETGRYVVAWVVSL